jgi:hypothetical protein
MWLENPSEHQQISLSVGQLLLKSLSVKIDCRSRAAVVIEPVSADSLRKTGIFADTTGDFRRFPRQLRQNGCLETKENTRKAWISGPFSRLSGSLAERGNGWLTLEDSNRHITFPEKPFDIRAELPLFSRNFG